MVADVGDVDVVGAVDVAQELLGDWLGGLGNRRGEEE
jgi:hypothetical protein